EVTVNALPVVDANAVDDSVCEEDMVTLYGSGASTYVWNNGVNNNEPFIADVGGTYTVTGTDSNGCQDTDMITITVYALPDVNAMVSDESVCSGSAVTFSGSGAVTYHWDNGVVNGAPFVPAGPGTFTVTGTDGNGCTDTDDITITMLPSPPVLAVATNATVCDGNFVTLTGSGALSYTWSNGVINGIPFAPTATGSYTVTGLGGNGCSASDDILITVNELPDVVANASTPVVCAGNELILFGTGAESYVWGGGVTDGMGFVPVASNNYTVTGTDNNGCSNADVIFVEVVLIPVVEANASSPFVCLGNDVTLTGSGAATYNWNNGVTDGEPFSPVLTATYTVVGIDENGCSGTDQITLEVYTPPVVTANANTVEVCAGGEVVLYGSGALEYQWSGGAIDNQPFQPAASGNFIVTGADEVGCIDTDEIYITVNQLPVIAFSLSDDSLCTDDGPLILNATPMGGSFFGTGVSGNVFTPTGLAEGSYNISYIYTDALGCTGQDIEQVWVDICDAINESALQPQWSLWPNPAEDKVWVEWNGGDASMQIFGANGEEVMTLKLKTSQFLNLESFATGIYFVVVSGDGFHTTKKLLID
ncbi:MAG: T9SS type A sorting domain-containing protein, partial [Flavobacteriales bacterium]|nr:T9SS type A sorting domain-containing protein [Flavobacteriales bacterium]